MLFEVVFGGNQTILDETLDGDEQKLKGLGIKGHGGGLCSGG